MTDKKISELSIATLTGTESVPLEQSGTTKRAEAQDIADLYNGGTVESDFIVRGTHLSLGAEQVTNGTFASNASGWTISDASIAWSGGKVVFTDTPSGQYITQNLTNAAGVHQAEITVSGYVDGSVSVIGGLNSEFGGIEYTADGTYTVIGYMRANAQITIIASNFFGTNCSIDNVSVKPIQDAAHLTVYGYENDTSLIAGNWNNGNVNVGRAALAGLTDGDGNTAVGYSALATLASGYSNVAIGTSAGDSLVNDYETVTIGAYADHGGWRSTVVGALAEGAENSVAIGYGTWAEAADSVLVGYGASSAADGGIAIGRAADVAGTDGVALGRTAYCTSTNGIAIGAGALSDGTNSIAIGGSAEASNIVVIGTDMMDETHLFGSVYLTGVVAPPGVAAANRAYLFTEDNGSGKMRLMVQFPSGSAIQLAIEP